MTKQSDIIPDARYRPLLDHGFCRLIDHMGDDAAIAQAARVSYGAGTRKVNEDRGLIRYLMRHGHSSPIEMCEFKFHLKLPIFVMRQLIRHRTASVNETSGRYSVMSDEFYLPDIEHIQPQNPNNKQGRAGELNDEIRGSVQDLLRTGYAMAYDTYESLLNEFDGAPGIARELARVVLPVANYTECYWKIDLSNLFKLIKLRADAHAQYEIRVYAEAMFELIQPIVPIACEAFVDYQRDAQMLSRMEIAIVRDLLLANHQGIGELISLHGGRDGVAQDYGLSKRELTEFIERFIR